MTKCGFDEFEPRPKIEEYLENLEMLNEELAELKRIKGLLERRIFEHLELAKFDEQDNVTSVVHDGAQTKYIGKYKATFKTPSLWKIDKKEYQIIKSQLRKEFDPIVISESYRVSNEVLRNIKMFGSEADNKIIEEFLTLDYSKPSITLVPNT